METIASQASAAKRVVQGKVEINIPLCKGCELCTAACDQQALILTDQINAKGYRYVVADNSKCTGCIKCALVCPDAVITVFRTKKLSRA